MQDEEKQLPVESNAQPEDQNQDDNSSDGSDYEQTNFWDYLQSEPGHRIAEKVLTIISEIKNVATTSISAERSARLSAELDLRKFQHKVQLAVFGTAVFVVAGLSIIGKLDSGVSMLLGTMVGYFFGKSKTNAS